MSKTAAGVSATATLDGDCRRCWLIPRQPLPLRCCKKTTVCCLSELVANNVDAAYDVLFTRSQLNFCPNAPLYQQFRPEFVALHSDALSSDAYTGFGRVHARYHNRKIDAATDALYVYVTRARVSTVHSVRSASCLLG